ncbi:MAG: hypothetical protein R2795_15825 [Saprospiraceae bacterium]
MQLHKIQGFIHDYLAWLATPEATTNLHYWETQANWQQHWNLDAPDLRAMYDRSLTNLTNRRIWKRQAYEPKQMMLTFLAMDPHFVHTMFTDLFNEDKDAHHRADRFVFYCDELMRQYRLQYPLTVETGHYHDDGYEMVSLYLAFQYPQLYAPFQAKIQYQLLKAVGAPNLPATGDFPRHVKVMRTLQTLLLKHPALDEAHRARLRNQDYQGDSLLLAFDFAVFVANMSGKP